MAEERKQPADSLRRLRLAVTLGGLGLAGAHIAWPSLTIDAVTLVLIAMALVPWLAPLFKSLELPGGWKVEFQELQKTAERAENAGLLSTAAVPSDQVDYTFQRMAREDPNLALAGLRIEIERRLVDLAQRNGIEPRNRSIGQLLRLLNERNVLGQEERSILADLTGLLNAAVHGATVDRQAADWAIEVGPRLLAALDGRKNESS